MEKNQQELAPNYALQTSWRSRCGKHLAPLILNSLFVSVVICLFFVARGYHEQYRSAHSNAMVPPSAPPNARGFVLVEPHYQNAQRATYAILLVCVLNAILLFVMRHFSSVVSLVICVAFLILAAYHFGIRY